MSLRHHAVGTRRGATLLAVLVTTSCLTLSAVPAGGAPAPAARLESFSLSSRLVDPSTPGGALEKDRTAPKVNVLLPKGYDSRSRRRYPVLWLLHGGGGGTDTWVPSIVELAKGFPGIIVMPDGGKFGMYTDWWNVGVRGEPAWATYHLQVFRQAIEHRYRIRHGRRWHAIGGISMGGQGALRYAAMLPGYFGSVATFSAAVPDMQSEAARVGLELLAAANGGGTTSYEAIFGPSTGANAEGNNPQALAPNLAHTRVFLTSGNGTNCPQDPIHQNSIALDTTIETTLHAQQAPFAEAVRDAGADVTAVTTCGVHTFGVWDRAFAAARAWGLFKPVARWPRQWTYRTAATTGDMWGLRFRFTRPPTAVAQFTRTGTTLRATGAGHVKIRGPRGCRLSIDLPFDHHLPTACVHPGGAR